MITLFIIYNHSFFTVYLVTLFFVIILIFNEFEYFLNPDPKFHFVPDADFEAKLQINIDMTVAMRCDSKFNLECKILLVIVVYELDFCILLNFRYWSRYFRLNKSKYIYFWKT